MPRSLAKTPRHGKLERLTADFRAAARGGADTQNATYGRVVVVMKPHVKRRCTYTLDDTFFGIKIAMPTSRRAEIEEKLVAAFAPELRAWEDFDFGDPRLRPFERELARLLSKDIADSFAGRKRTRFAGGDRSIYQTMLDDAGRQTYVINGRTYLHGTNVGGQAGIEQQRAVIDAFREAVPDPKARKALSALMNQSGPGDLFQAILHIPVADPNGGGGTIDLHALGGADKLINRNMMTGLHTMALHDPTMTFGLDVAPDGRTAVVTITLDTNLEVGDNPQDHFGNALVRERITVDLNPDVPVVTDVRLSQELR